MRLLSHSQVAERLGVDRRTVGKMIGLGQLPSVWVGDRTKVPEAALEEVLRVERATGIGAKVALAVFTALVESPDALRSVVEAAKRRAEAPHLTGEDGTARRTA